jgi:hypothetical protein
MNIKKYILRLSATHAGLGCPRGSPSTYSQQKHALATTPYRTGFLKNGIQNELELVLENPKSK